MNAKNDTATVQDIFDKIKIIEDACEGLDKDIVKAVLENIIGGQAQQNAQQKTKLLFNAIKTQFSIAEKEIIYLVKGSYDQPVISTG